MNVTLLGEARVVSPLSHTLSGDVMVPYHILREPGKPAAEELLFELAGPRRMIYFDPRQVRAGIVTCGGLCPGLNNVIRSLYHELHHAYGVREVIGFRDGYMGLDPSRAREPFVLDADFVEDIHKEGGTVLGTSRGPVDVGIAVDNLIRRGINMLFALGGDGTQRGAFALHQEARRRNHPLAVVGVPKTIDNDVAFVSRTFGFFTAVEEACKAITCAHTEVHSVQNGIALVKLMGRHAGFIAAGATIASQDVNFTLIPEVPFKLEGEKGFLAALKRRILKREHAVIVVAEGAGQDLLQADSESRDASGNVKLKDIGPFLRDRIETYFKAEKIPCTMRYIDPSYTIRSVPADAEDSILCDLFARNAVHAAMAGKTGIVIGLVHDKFVHVPSELLTSRKKSIEPNSNEWRAVLAATGQPDQFE